LASELATFDSKVYAGRYSPLIVCFVYERYCSQPLRLAINRNIVPSAKHGDFHLFLARLDQVFLDQGDIVIGTAHRFAVCVSPCHSSVRSHARCIALYQPFHAFVLSQFIICRPVHSSF